MKWLVYLFSFYILLLSGVPCNGGDECCADEIGNAAASGRADHPGKKAPAPCSPFFACCSCHGVVMPDMQVSLVADAPVLSPLHSFYITPAFPDFASVVWQPPKRTC